MNRSPIFDYAVVNGRLLPYEQAHISIFNKALWFSFGVYETVKIDHGCPFYLEEHLRRLLQSANLLDLGLTVDIPSLASWYERLAEVDREATWSLRIVALGPEEPGDTSIIAMQADELPTYARNLYREGALAVMYAGQRALPTCKSLNTLVNYLARRTAHHVGAVEGLLHHDGYLTEGARSNLFAVRQGQLITPPASAVLSGITRDIIIKVMQATDHPVIEQSVPVDLSLYEEVFITSTSMHILPITTIDGTPAGNGQVGPVTQLAMAAFENHYKQVLCAAPSQL